MRYVQTAGWEKGITDLTERLVRELKAGHQVLWLISGGSNIPASTKVIAGIDDQLTQKLTITLVDERFGPVGHSDSNWTKLVQAGFNGKSARLVPTLLPMLDRVATVRRQQEFLIQAFRDSAVVIAQLGIGEDCHIAGILPNSSAAQSDELYLSYDSPPLVRLTTTFNGLKHLTAAYVFAFGGSKREAVESLKKSDVDPIKQPAQFLKTLAEVHLYSDQIGDQK